MRVVWDHISVYQRISVDENARYLLSFILNSWSTRLLYKGGKEVLITSISLALSTYFMANIFLPLDICEKLASDIARFWWSSNPPRKRFHWAK